MHLRPRSIQILSSVYLICGVIMLIFGTELSSNSPFVNMMISSFIYGLIFCVQAYGIWTVRPWGYYLYLLASSILVLDLLYGYMNSPTFISYGFLFAVATCLALVSFFVQKHVSAPYFNPEQRWWETAARFKAGLTITLESQLKTREAHLVDLSMTGCYLHLSNQKSTLATEPLSVLSDLTVTNDIGTLLFLQIECLGLPAFQVMCKTVRVGIDGGIGAMFIDMTKEDRTELKNLIRNIEETHWSKSATTAESEKEPEAVA